MQSENLAALITNADTWYFFDLRRLCDHAARYLHEHLYSEAEGA
jgi:hypothetical protein